MIYPNKHIKIEESIIYKMIFVLEAIVKDITIQELYSKTRKKLSNADEFIYSLDVLYILDMIDVDFTNETVNHVERN